MAIDFPSSPTVGDIYSYGGATWQWNGVAWDGISSSQGSQGTTGAQGLTGIQGAVGLQGTQGVQGTTGSQGVTGIQGETGLQGTQGLQGSTGAQGIQGTTGIQGTQGIQGETGSQGTQGTQGILGLQGTTGTQGLTGIQGAQGTQGIQGLQGTTGSQGTQGVQGQLGSQGTQGIQGLQGSIGLNWRGSYAQSQTYAINDAVQWLGSSWRAIAAVPINTFPSDANPTYWALLAAQGTDGIQGLQGVQGTQGIQGRQGTQGIQGSQGTTGIQGAQGNNWGFTTAATLTLNNEGFSGTINSVPTNLAWSIGEGIVLSHDALTVQYGIVTVYNTTTGVLAYNCTGYIGNAGTYSGWTASLGGQKGIQGLTGNQGTQGIQGTIGLQGLSGNNGSQGTQGLQGTTGSQGTQGLQGPQGTTGIQGLTGTQGTQGLQGLTGTQGTQGLQGVQGTQSVQGTQGVQGPLPGAPLALTQTGNSASYPFTISSSNQQGGGAGYSDITKLVNTHAGATNPNKFFRLSDAGALEIINSAYSGSVMSATDAGDVKSGNHLLTGSGSLYNQTASNQSLTFKSDGGVDLVWGSSTTGREWRFAWQNDRNVVLYTGATANWQTSTGTSDRNLKDEIQPTQINAVAIIKALEVVDFKWKEDGDLADGGKVHTGFIAQDVEPLIPDAVSKPSNYILHKQELVPALVKALQEALARIEALEAKDK